MKSQNIKLLIVICSITLIILSACGQVSSATPTIKVTNTQPPIETLVPTQTPNPFPNPTLRISGEVEVVFDWTKDKCEALDIPDLPARAFRDEEGNVQLIAAHYINYRFIGPNLSSLKRDCNPVMESASLQDPSLYSYHQWLSSPYTEDGKTIYALVHNEFYGSKAYNVPCSPAHDGDLSCWYNAITLAVSTDRGATYQVATDPPGNLVTSAPYIFEAGAGPYGFFNPSNIIKGKDGYYYVYMREHFYHQGDNGAGICVIRTNNLSDASSWRAWDGKDFTVSFINPYLNPDKAKSALGCSLIPAEPGLGVMGESITFNTYLNRYVMVGVTAMQIGGREVWGVLYSFSDDLVHWQPRKLLLETELSWTWQPGDDDNVYLYPSLIDPDSPSRNFETTGKHAYLYLTRFNYYKKGVSDHLDRDLIRIPVEFFPSEATALLETNGYAWEFELDGDTEGWGELNQLTALQVSDGHLVTESMGVDPFMDSAIISIDANALPIIKLNMKVTSGKWAQLFFITNIDGDYDEAKSLRFEIQGDGAFHEYVLDMSKVKGWEGAITQIRLDPVEVEANIEIDYIRMEKFTN